MGQILRHWRVGTAVLFSLVLIAGASLLVRGVKAPPSVEASAESALLQEIAAKDSDGDGLPDWQEALYGTDPHATDTFQLGMTDGEAVAKGLIVPKAIADLPVAASSPLSFDSQGLPSPAADGSLTDFFAKNFFSLFLSSKQARGGASLSDSDVTNIMNTAVTSLSSAVATAPDFKSIADLTVAGSGTDALAAFAADIEAIFLRHADDGPKSSPTYLQEAVDSNDASALAALASRAKAYREMATGLSALPVPQELSTANLALINTMMRMSEITSDFARVNDDPLAAMLALKQYLPAAEALTDSFSSMAAVYARSDVALSSGAPGASFLKDIATIAAAGQGSSSAP